tara:strand:+ start:63 stop:602 length:540 start_codon:yes stop_codon:yes gene_type:complete
MRNVNIENISNKNFITSNDFVKVFRKVKLTNNAENFISAEKFKVGDIAIYIKRNNQYLSMKTFMKLHERDRGNISNINITLSNIVETIPIINDYKPTETLLKVNPFDRQRLYRKDIEFVRFISNTKTNINKLREKVKNAEKAYKPAKMRSKALESASKKNRRPNVNNNNKPKTKRVKSK